MDDEDYEDLIEIVKDRMRENGLSDLAEDSNFLDPDALAEGRAELPPPQTHLILLLEAFQLHLKWTDRDTVEDNLRFLHESVENGPENAFIEFPDRADGRPLFLREIPSLGPLRSELQRLIVALQGEDYEPSPGMER
ncbi:hypothetical protein [Pannonibacter phragmitetus]|uniref:Uncharacterized protein n=1 Tax=Pannonibacter phragmitetus TaxID=121719 RepID=A0A0U3NCK6_9HYPH|nr:hypothetical protein [Pannonibacter phragmitetus]ALV29099.1 hypothetical protein APZ00_20330 [Pannonibacter phragmitetus]